MSVTFPDGEVVYLHSSVHGSAYDATIETGPPVETDDPEGYLLANRRQQAAEEVARLEMKVAKATPEDKAEAERALAAARAHQEGLG